MGRRQLAGADQQLDIVKAHIVIGRVSGQGFGQLVLGALHVTAFQQGLRLVRLGLGQHFVLAGQVFVQELLDLALGQGAGKTIHRPPAHHQDAGRNAFDAKS